LFFAALALAFLSLYCLSGFDTLDLVSDRPIIVSL